MKKWTIWGTIAFSLTFFLLQKCTSTTSENVAPPQLEFQGQTFESVDELETYMRNQLAVPEE